MAWRLLRLCLQVAAAGSLLTALTAYGFPRVLSVHAAPEIPSFPGAPVFALLELEQSLESHRVSVSLLETNHDEFGAMAVASVLEWQFDKAPERASRPPTGKLLLFSGLDIEQEIWSHLEMARPRRRTAPAFPERVPMGLSGPVVVRMLVLPDGRVDVVGLTECAHPEFGAEAIQAVVDWEFTPAKWRGEPVAVLVRSTVNFQTPLLMAMRVGGQAYHEEDQRLFEAKGSAILLSPMVRRFALPPFPAELAGKRRPRTLEFTVLLDVEGRIAGVNAEKLPEEWRDHFEGILETWQLTPAFLDHRAVPWLVGFSFEFPEPYPGVLRSAFRRDSAPRAEDLPDPPVLLAELHQPFDYFGNPPPDPLFAEIDLLVAPTGVVAATRVVDTNDPAFARFVRSRAAYNVYTASRGVRQRPAVWVRQRFSTAP